MGMKIAIATADSSDGVQLFLEANNAQGLVDFVMSASDDMEPKPSKVLLSVTNSACGRRGTTALQTSRVCNVVPLYPLAEFVMLYPYTH